MSKVIAALIILISSLSLEARFQNRWPSKDKINVVMSDSVRALQWQDGHGPLVNDEFQMKMNLITDSQVVEGNRAMLLVNGMMSYKVRYQLLETAKKSIVISVLSIHPKGKRKGVIKDIYTKRFVDALIAAKQRGVEVKLIYDGMTSWVSKTQKVMDLLTKKGIQVIKYNPFGNQSRDRIGFFPLDALNFLRKFAWRRWFRGEFLLNNRWHDKTMIIDGKYAIVGGLNWGDYYAEGTQFSAREYDFRQFINEPLSKEIGLDQIFHGDEGWGPMKDEAWRDTDLLIAGPAVANIQTRILKDFLTLEQMMKRKKYKFQNVSPEIEKLVEQRFDDVYRDNPDYFPLDDHSSAQGLKLRYIYQRPFIQSDLQEHRHLRSIARQNDLEVNQNYPQTFISNYYLNIIHRARKQILWGSFSLVAVPQIERALIQAAMRGVNIYIITNSKETAKGLGDRGFITYRRNKKTYKKLLKYKNIRFFEWQSEKHVDGQRLRSGSYHAKNMDVDGVISIVGSYNISHASYDHHTESVAVIYDPEFSKKNQEMFYKDLLYTKEVLWK